MSKLQGRLLDDIIAGTIILWRVLFIICHTIVTKILIAMFQPCTAGLHQMIVSIYWQRVEEGQHMVGIPYFYKN